MRPAALNYLEAEADSLGMARSQFIVLLLQHYREHKVDVQLVAQPWPPSVETKRWYNGQL